MPVLHQYDYIFVIGLLFAALDAYNIGANDVANSFATSVSSRSLTLRQACVLAALCEFLGAVLVGARVAGTIKNGIISLSSFQGNPGVQMLGFTCALVTSATWLMIATKKSWPVSTTYSIVSALAGVGVALGGTDAVQWGWNGGKGLATIFAGLVIAPSIAAGFGAIVYLITKYAVLVRKDPVRKGLYMSPLYFFTVTAVLTMSIVYKGAPALKLDKLPEVTVALAIFLTSLVVSILAIIFWLPFVYCKVVRKDYSLRWYHFFLGPLLWRRPTPEPLPESQLKSHVADYRVYGRDQQPPSQQEKATDTTESSHSSDVEGKVPQDGETAAPAQNVARPSVPLDAVEEDPHKIEGLWILPRNLWILVRYRLPKVLLHGSTVDVHKMQTDTDSDRMARIFAQSQQYENETEHMYSFLQVLTACTNSFAHGSNDVSNAVGPFAAIYYVWSEGVVTPKDTPTPVWILAFGGALIVIGLATYGYNIMAVLGNRLTLHSPSRGFSMELGSSITVLLASQYGIPVSTTMCITGATAGVGMVSGGPKAINWRAFGWILLGWVLTVPIVGTGAGVLTALFINAPHW